MCPNKKVAMRQYIYIKRYHCFITSALLLLGFSFSYFLEFTPGSSAALQKLLVLAQIGHAQH